MYIYLNEKLVLLFLKNLIFHKCLWQAKLQQQGKLSTQFYKDKCLMYTVNNKPQHILERSASKYDIKQHNNKL